jgi:hypothetical protein
LEEDFDEDDLTEEPEELDRHPKDEIGLEAHLPDNGVPEHDPVNLEVTPHDQPPTAW